MTALMNSLYFIYASLIFLCFFPCYAKKPEPFINPMKQDIFLINPKTFQTIIGRFRNSNGVSLLLHFNSKDPKQKSFIDNVYNEAAKESNGMLRFAAIDCSQATTFCKENENPQLNYPHVVLYPPHPVPAFPLQKLEKKAMIQQAIRYISGEHIVKLNTTNIQKFLSQSVAIPKVLLFSTKPQPPVIYKALSNAFSDRLSFGFIESSETSLAQKYKIKSFPKLLAFRSGARQPEYYDEPIKYSNVHEWLNIRAETFVKGGGFSVTSSDNEVSKPWLTETVPELTGASYNDICFKKSSLCSVYLSKGNITQPEIEVLEGLSQQYSEDAQRGAKFRWMWMDLAKEKEFQALFSVQTSQLPSFVVINPHKRLRFFLLKPPQTATAQNMKGLLETIMAGDARFVPFKNQKIPKFSSGIAKVEPKKRQDEL